MRPEAAAKLTESDLNRIAQILRDVGIPVTDDIAKAMANGWRKVANEKRRLIRQAERHGRLS